MSLVTQRKGQIGVNAVERVVLRDWHSRWQSIDSANDDGIDGLIFIESGGHATGQVVFAQIKYRKKQQPDKKGRLAVSISKKRLNAAVERWRRLVGAVILICVSPDGSTMHWSDLLQSDSIKGTRIYVPTKNKFDASALSDISALCGTLHRDVLLTQVSTTTEDFAYLKDAGSLQQLARQFYRKLAKKQYVFKGSTADIRFTREGWLHLTRRRRPRLVQLQSFQLLGAIGAIIKNFPEEKLTRVKRNRTKKEYAVVRAAVSFPFRQTAVVAAVFRRRERVDGTVSYSFYTIYEPRRRRDVTGKKRKVANRSATHQQSTRSR
jgi:hypothetical protein